MNTMNDVLALWPAYEPALIALLLLCFAVMVQNFLTAPLAFIKNEQTPGKPLNGGHELLSFRVIRTYANSVENLPAFGLTLLAAVLTGADATFVNWLAGAHLIFRMLFWAVYYTGIGKAAGGPRTICFVGGLLSNMALAAAALVHVI